MRTLFYRALLINAIFLFSCKGKSAKPKNEKDSLAYSFYENGNIHQILRLRNNKLNGKSENYYEDGKLRSLKFFSNDSAFGPFMEFYPSGLIKRYSFLVSDNHTTYQKEFDKKGILVKELGSPLVKYHHSFSQNKDTLYFNFIFSDFGFEDLKVSISSDGINYKSPTLLKLELERVKELKGWKPMTTLNRTSFYIKMEENKSLYSKKYYDTITFEKLKK